MVRQSGRGRQTRFVVDVPLVVTSARTDLRGGVVVLLLECGHGGRGGVGDGVGDLAVQPAHVAAHERVPAPHHREGSASLYLKGMR